MSGRSAALLAYRLAGGAAWLVLTGWCTLAIALAPSGPNAVTWSLGTGFALLCLCAALGPLPRALRSRPARAGALTAAWGAVVAWFLLVPAPADADWQPDVAEIASFEIDGDLVTVSGIRNFRYRTSDADFEPAWAERTYDLRRLRTVDLFFSFWGPKLICHNFVSFGFERDDGTHEQLVVSIEVRKRRGQEYSALGGLFRQFPLAYVWADERDVVRVRTNFRGERVRRYRVLARQENVRILFERYMADTMELERSPRWYNAVTQNCGIDILRTAWGGGVPLFPSPALLLNGTWEERAWDDGHLFPQGSLEETLRAADITEDAKAAGMRDFGQAIRRRATEIRMGAPSP
jgi:hypothetical protein